MESISISYKDVSIVWHALQSSERNFLVMRNFVYKRAAIASVLSPKPKRTVKY